MKQRIYIGTSVIGGCEDEQIVNLDRIHAFTSVNLKLGYLILEIMSPREVIHEEEI